MAKKDPDIKLNTDHDKEEVMEENTDSNAVKLKDALEKTEVKNASASGMGSMGKNSMDE